jgi:glycosyltransferase involved in cell wall biosynthesis
MDISIVICTTNRASDLRDTLASLARVNCPGTVELLVVDNCSTDSTRLVVEEAAKPLRTRAGEVCGAERRHHGINGAHHRGDR